MARKYEELRRKVRARPGARERISARVAELDAALRRRMSARRSS